MPTSRAELTLFLRRGAAIVLVMMAATLLPAQPAGAHTDMREAWPGPGPPVGGTIDKIEFWFWGAVLEASFELKGPDGDLFTGETVRLDDDRLRFDFGGLEQAGEHRVDYTILAADGDTTTSAYVFTYDPDAPAVELPSVLAAANGGSVAFWIVSLIAIAAGAFLLLGGRDERKRT